LVITVFDNPFELSGATSFQDQVLGLLDRLAYRRVGSADELLAIGKLRYDAFDAKQIYKHKEEGVDVLIDDYDQAANAMNFAIDFDGELVATVRLQLISQQHPASGSTDMFPSVLLPQLDQGLRYIDPNRLAVDLETAKTLPGLPHAVLRLAVMATRHLGADACLSHVRKEHAAFYRRIFGARVLAGPIEHPDMNASPVLLASRRSSYETLCGRFPFYRYVTREAASLFGAPQSRPITPTAREAIALLETTPDLVRDLAA
jgi:hypothetical protein